MKKNSLVLFSGALLFVAGCSTPVEKNVPYYVNAAEAQLTADINVSDRAMRLYAAEAKISPALANFTAERGYFGGAVDELSIRVAGAIAEIRRQALDSHAPEHIKALETSAKLHLHYSAREQSILHDIHSANYPGRDHAIWVLADNGDESALKTLDGYLSAGAKGAYSDVLSRSEEALTLSESMRRNEIEVAVTAAGFLEKISPEWKTYLTKIADNERNSYAGAIALLSLAKHDAVPAERIADELKYQQRRQAPQEMIAILIRALGESGSAKDVLTLGKYMESTDDITAIDAAGAIIKIDDRLPKFRY